MNVFMHSPKHYEYLCGLGNALEQISELRVTFFSVEDFYCRDYIKFQLIDQYPDSARFRGKFSKLLPHLRAVASFMGKLVSDRPDVLHVQAFRHHGIDWPILITAKLLGTRIVLTVHNLLPHETKLGDRPIFKLIYRFVDHLIAHTHHTAAKLVEQMNVKPDKITIIPHGTLEFQLRPAINRKAARNYLSIREDVTVLLFFGRIREYKGVDLLVEAVQRIDDPTVKLVIAGRDSIGLGSRIGTDDRIVFHGDFIDNSEVRYYFAAADLVVLPYRKIDQSGVLLLAISSGRPVLGTNVGGIGEIIEDGVNGFLCEPDNGESLTDKLAEILARRSDLDAIGEKCKKSVNDNFCWDSVATQTAAVYRDLTRSR